MEVNVNVNERWKWLKINVVSIVIPCLYIIVAGANFRLRKASVSDWNIAFGNHIHWFHDGNFSWNTAKRTKPPKWFGLSAVHIAPSSSHTDATRLHSAVQSSMKIDVKHATMKVLAKSQIDGRIVGLLVFRNCVHFRANESESRRESVHHLWMLKSESFMCFEFVLRMVHAKKKKKNGQWNERNKIATDQNRR